LDGGGAIPVIGEKVSEAGRRKSKGRKKAEKENAHEPDTADAVDEEHADDGEDERVAAVATGEDERHVAAQADAVKRGEQSVLMRRQRWGRRNVRLGEDDG
jgi:hypothetical protein